MRRLLILFCLFASSAAAQGSRFDSTVTQQSTVAGVTNVVTIPSSAQIAFCNFPANATPCTNKAVTYTSQTLLTPCSTSTQIVLTGTTTCVASPDAQQNWGVWVPAGIYSYTITLPGGVNLGPYNVTLGIPLNSNITWTGIFTASGALNSTNTTTGISSCLINGSYVAGSSCYATIQAAVTAAGATGTVLIPSTYAGVDIYNNPNTISVIDLRPSVGGYGGMTVGTGITQFAPSVSTANTAFGAGVLVNGIQTVNNSAFGFGALNSELVGASNSAFGRQALGADTYGRFNSGFGVQALQANVSGSFNTAMGGEGVLSNHLFGDYNSAYGDSAMQLNISGQDNTSVGESSLFNNTTGSLNTAVGSSALFSQTASNQNTAVGNTALFAVNAGKAITSFSNFGGGQVQATSNGHGFSNGNSVIISGSTFQIPNPLVIPLVSQNASGGSIGSGTYWVKITLFHCTHSQTFAADCPTNPPQTETLASPETSIVVAAGTTNQLIVTRPVLRPSIADGFCVYMSTSSGNETKQGCEIGFASAANLAGTITFNTCCSAGAAVPVANTTAGNNYNGTYVIANVAANTFTFTATFVGTQTGAYAQLASAATNNAAIGYGAGAGVTTGSQNSFLGADLSHTITQGSTNTCLGYNTCSGITTGSGNTVVGAFVSGLPAGLTQNIILADGSGGIRAQWDLTNWNFSSPLVPTVAGAQTLGTTPLPWGKIILGPTTANQSIAYTPGAMGGNRTVNVLDPGAAAVNEMFSSNTSTTVTQVPHATATAGVYTNSAIVSADEPSSVVQNNQVNTGGASMTLNMTSSGAITPSQTNGIVGTTTNNNANAGAVGEYVQSVLATGSSVTLATGVTSNVTSISLTAGDWDVTGAVDFTFGATTSYTNLIGSVSTTTGTIGGQDSKFDFETPAAVPTAGADATFPLPVVRFSLSGTTTVFLVAQGTFTVSTLKAYGTIRARRVR